MGTTSQHAELAYWDLDDLISELLEGQPDEYDIESDVEDGHDSLQSWRARGLELKEIVL